jgi:outer membrane protein TolC
MSRSFEQFRLTVEESLTNVELAVREVHTSYRELVAKYQSVEAAQDEVEYLWDRWRVVAGVDEATTLLLENLLDAQKRLVDEEGVMAQAQVNYALSIVRLKREMGTLFKFADATDVSTTR